MEKLKRSRIIDPAKGEVKDFSAMYERLEQKVALGGLPDSTLLNSGRCIAKISLHLAYTSGPKDFAVFDITASWPQPGSTEYSPRPTKTNHKLAGLLGE